MRDTTTKYQVRLKVSGYGFPPMSWNCKRDGRPTAANLKKFVESFEASTRKGGANAHLGATTVSRAAICLNDGSRKVVVSYTAPLFTVIS
jgi:hypothetical protein